MKTKLTFILTVLISLTSCKVDAYLISERDSYVYQFEFREKSVYRGNTEIARLTALEWEYNNNKITQELSFELINTVSIPDVKILLKFLHTKFPNEKIEINMDHVWKSFEESN